MNLKNLTDLELHNSLKNKASAERAILVDVVSHIHEADRRRLYMQYNYPNLFEYLVKEMNFHGGSAQRRIDAARLLGDVPEIRSDIASGALNLMQLSAVSQGIKQKVREGGSIRGDIIQQKRELVALVKGQSLSEAQKTIAQTLDIEIKMHEKKSCQKDGSMRVELTLTAEQVMKMNKAKDLLSHTHPHATVADLLDIGLSEIIKKKDPTLKGVRSGSGQAKVKGDATKDASSQNISTTTVEVTTGNLEVIDSEKALAKTPSVRKPIPAQTKRMVFQKHQGCQWSERGRKCGSTFQSQIDHIVPVRAGGGNDLSNLQIL